MKNPFLTYGYAGTDYFCDRVEETKRLTTLLSNGNHVALISPRRMGKTGLLKHCFSQEQLQKDYYLFVVDIYATKSLAEFTHALGRAILSVLKSKERRAWERFLHVAGSLRTGITFDEFGKPSWNVQVGDIRVPQISLDEIFQYLSQADKPCLVAIDEFQSIVDYEEKNVERGHHHPRPRRLEDGEFLCVRLLLPRVERSAHSDAPASRTAGRLAGGVRRD